MEEPLRIATMKHPLTGNPIYVMGRWDGDKFVFIVLDKNVWNGPYPRRCYTFHPLSCDEEKKSAPFMIGIVENL